MKKITLLTICFVSVYASVFQTSMHAAIEKLSHTEIQNLLAPITFTPTGIDLFFKERFNKQRYTRDILHSSFLHMIDLLEYGQDVEKKRAYINMIFELFHTRLKDCYWVNPFALAQLLEKLPAYVHDVCQEDGTEVKSAIKSALYDALHKYDTLKQNPESFITELSEQVYSIARQEDDIPAQELRYTIARFIESALNKLIWAPEDQEETWNCCKLLGEQLLLLTERSIIPHEKITNQLVWSMLYRYSYFMETMASELKPSTYAAIKNDLTSMQVPFLLLPEQERLMTSKMEHLKDRIIENEVIVFVDASMPVQSQGA